ncbi:MAG: DUF115 domain-containing protein [Treponema sp.]|nr:DUF115 domain-containing protein [Treponema sp.]
MGYIIPVLKERFKNSKIIALHVDDNYKDNHFDIPVLYTTENSKVKKFLENEVPEIDSDKIRIIEWRPSLTFYKEAYLSLFSLVVNFLKRFDAGRRTTAVFGKRWLKNFFKNLKVVKKTLLYRQTSLPVIVTGAGPGLEQALPLIAKMQETCLIIAASSSFLSLSSHGIHTDIVIATDGGPWALRHIYPVFRNNSSKTESVLAVNLCAALPSQSTDMPFLIINDGSYWQSIILNKLGIPSVVIGQKGTVIATAVELALLLSSGNIYLAGMDFSIRDIRTHVRPYAFDNIFLMQANRLRPFYSQSFTRSKLLKEGGSMDIYAAWFADQIQTWPKRIHTLTNKKEKTIKNTKEIFKEQNINEDPDLFYKRGIDALLTGINNPEYEEMIIKELFPLLLPDKKTSPLIEAKQDLIKALHETLE